ncbi:calcium-binding protein [Falsirhodobacter algicola]|uniref:Peptidase M10 serralysin C-terminal domain-containing protein n=1 Tax=Falsirhodobacter algicola TaxID=2692330 RepID=A0A8J8MSU5_9RHOB|nr:calcium-binding protein [Falsirhodobacter algicola]QUS36090.1 hypothetical protein GR316_07290 [Falsirhodobacter algicola]
MWKLIDRETAGDGSDLFVAMTLVETGADAVLYTSTRYGGSVRGWSLAKGLDALSAPLPQGRSDAAGVAADLVYLPIGDGALLYGGGGTGGLFLRLMRSDGALATPLSLGAPKALKGNDLTHAAAVTLDDGRIAVIGGLARTDGIGTLIFDASGKLVSSAIGQTGAQAVTAVAATEIGGKDYILTLGDGAAPILKLWSMGADAALTERASLSSAQGLWVQAPTALATAALDGKTFAIVAAAGSSSLTVVQIGSSGSLTVRDHVLDDQNTRFGGATALEVVQAQGAVWVLTGGDDGGLSLLRLLPDGRLLSAGMLADTDAMGLQGIYGIAAQAAGDGLDVYVTSTEGGVTRLHATLPSGKLISGTAAVLSGGTGDDILMDGAGSQTLKGGAGADVFVMASDGRADTISGFELGKDRIDLSAWGLIRSLDQLTFASKSNGITITYGKEVLQVLSSTGKTIKAAQLSLSDLVDMSHLPPVLPDLPPSTNVPGGLTALRGSSAEDRLVGSGRADTLMGFGGDDTLWGNDGKDLIQGGGGGDELYGGNGADRIYGGDGKDVLWAGAGNDSLWGGSGDDTLWGQNGNDSLSGGNGRDLLQGGNGNDTLRGENGDDTLRGDAGADSLVGAAGADVLYGGAGNDRMWGGNGADLLQGGNGNDKLYGGSSNDKLYGENGNDSLWGDNGNDKLYGGANNDLLYGGAGRDRLEGGGAKDTLYGGGSADTLLGQDGTDKLYGENGNDWLEGGAGNDTLFGGAGADTLIGGTGVDALTGGTGADVFVFQRASDSAKGKPDTITDFSRGTDHIDLRPIDADAALKGDQAFAFLGTKAFSADGHGEVRVADHARGVLASIDINGDGRMDMEILLSHLSTLSASDFLL